MRIWPRFVYEWGSSARERELPFACDRLIADPDDVLFRAVDVSAGAGSVFRWLCQLRVAPYSYDRFDNWGRQSPPTLTDGLERLQVGQRVMSIFRIADFEQDRSITIVSHARPFGHVACTYRVEETAPGCSRLVVKLLIAYPARALRGVPMRLLLPPGDLVMMRRQLLNLRELAESA